MALIKCPGCQADVSDKAVQCAQCACPIAGGASILASEAKPNPIPSRVAGAVAIVTLVLIAASAAVFFGYSRPKTDPLTDGAEPSGSAIQEEVLAEKEGPAGKGDPEPRSKFLVAYDDVKEERHMKMREAAKAGNFLETFADSLNREFVLPEDVTIALSECGTTNAFYRADQKRITLCYEILEKISELLGQEKLGKTPVPIDQAVFNAVSAAFGSGPAPVDRVVYTEQGLEDARSDAVVFIFYHELGHALVDVFGIPITGKEEDAVDQVATLLLAREGQRGELAAIDAAVVWGQWGKENRGSLNFSDEHSLDQQRFYNMMCWAYGREPENWQKKLIDSGLLPKARAGRCEAEYRQLEKSWSVLLGPHLTRQAKTEWDNTRVANMTP